MSITSSEEMFAELMALRGQSQPPFQPSAYYDRDGDCVEFLVKPDGYYGKREDDLVTIFYSHESNEIVGALIKGIRQLTHEKSSTEIVITDRRIRLELLFLLAAEKSGHKTRTINYNKLITMADETEVELSEAFA